MLVKSITVDSLMHPVRSKGSVPLVDEIKSSRRNVPVIDKIKSNRAVPLDDKVKADNSNENIQS